jgi:hypothetical protein
MSTVFATNPVKGLGHRQYYPWGIGLENENDDDAGPQKEQTDGEDEDDHERHNSENDERGDENDGVPRFLNCYISAEGA